MKRCSKCGLEKPLTEFWRDAHTPDGKYRHCKDCCREAQRQWKAKNPERVKHHAKKFREEHPEQVKQWMRDAYERNPQKYIDYATARKDRDPEAWAYLQFRNRLRREYGLAIEDYERMLAEQGELCAICRGPQTPGRRLAVDHCHKTGLVRGLLCDNCNKTLGLFGESAERFDRCAEYLRRHNGS